MAGFCQELRISVSWRSCVLPEHPTKGQRRLDMNGSEHMTGLFADLAEKLRAGERLDVGAAMALFETRDLFCLGRLAEQITVHRQSRNVYYSVNRHINYTNVCHIGCGFCGFSRKPGELGGYVMTPADVVARAEEARDLGATELHIVGGVNPELPFEYYVEMIEGIARECPQLHIKAFTAIEVINMAQKSELTAEAVLGRLRDAGLGALPGGGAEILSEDYFRRVCPRKPGPEQWLAVHAAAHRLGIMTNATMLYGYSESLEDRVNHLMRLRQLQDESLRLGRGRFQCFVPLPYVAPGRLAEAMDVAGESIGSDGSQDGLSSVENDLSGKAAQRIDAIDDLRTIAVSRLFLDNMPHIKAFWPMLGVKLAQVALCFGADDMDGTVQQYTIVEQDSARPNHLSEDDLRRMIIEADRVPVRRDGFYGAI